MKMLGSSITEDEKKYAQYLERVLLCDSDESIIAARALINFKNTVYEEKMVGYQIFELLEVTSGGTGFESFGYVMDKMFGEAEIIDTEGDDLPRSDVSESEFLEPVRTIATSFGWTLEDMWKMARTGRSLDSKKAKSARRSIMQKIDNNGFFGSPKSKLKGLLDSTLVAKYSSYDIPENGSGSGATRAKWGNKTGLQILTDANAMYTKIIENTDGIFRPNLFALSDGDFDIISNVYRSDNDSRTIKEIFEANKKVKIVPITKLKTTNADEPDFAALTGKDVKLLLNNSDECISYEVPLLFEQRPLQERGLKYLVPCVSQISSVQVRQPKSICISKS